MTNQLEWRAVSANGSLHLGLIAETDYGVGFSTTCDQGFIVDQLIDDPKRHRCSRCLDHEATRDKR